MFTNVFKYSIKNINFFESHSETMQKKISIWQFLMTGVQLSDEFIDQAYMQLSRNYTSGNADSSSNGISWNIETS